MAEVDVENCSQAMQDRVTCNYGFTRGVEFHVILQAAFDVNNFGGLITGTGTPFSCVHLIENTPNCSVSRKLSSRARERHSD